VTIKNTRVYILTFPHPGGELMKIGKNIKFTKKDEEE